MLHLAAHYVDRATARAMQVALEYDVETWAPPFPPRDLPEPTPDELTALIGLMPAGPAAEIVREIYDHAGAAVPT